MDPLGIGNNPYTEFFGLHLFSTFSSSFLKTYLSERQLSGEVSFVKSCANASCERKKNVTSRREVFFSDVTLGCL